MFIEFMKIYTALHKRLKRERSLVWGGAEQTTLLGTAKGNGTKNVS